jgi:hypothetical protein
MYGMELPSLEQAASMEAEKSFRELKRPSRLLIPEDGEVISF